ncbi:MAG: hypothetical protein ACI9OJ_002126 [Myxococcota bacterium]|jgi:hypothetical protein
MSLAIGLAIIGCAGRMAAPRNPLTSVLALRRHQGPSSPCSSPATPVPARGSGHPLTPPACSRDRRQQPVARRRLLTRTSGCKTLPSKNSEHALVCPSEAPTTALRPR